MAKVRKNSELSEKSYQAYLSTGKLDTYKKAILRELAKGPRTRRELVHLVHSGNPSNITAPLKQLENQDLITRYDIVQDPFTGREVIQYCLAPPTIPLSNNRELLGYALHPGSSDSKNGVL